MTNTTTSTDAGFKAIDAANGVHLRDATEAEIEAFWAGQTSPRVKRGEFTFTVPVLVGAVLIDHYNGPGAWYGGAGF